MHAYGHRPWLIVVDHAYCKGNNVIGLESILIAATPQTYLQRIILIVYTHLVVSIVYNPRIGHLVIITFREFGKYWRKRHHSELPTIEVLQVLGEGFHKVDIHLLGKHRILLISSK